MKIKISDPLIFSKQDIFRVDLKKVEWVTITIECVYFTWNIFMWRQLSWIKKSFDITFTDFFIAEAWVSTRISPSFSSSRQPWFFWFNVSLSQQRKQKN